MQGRLYSVGIGPGDPELMTLKAVRLLKECDVIVEEGRRLDGVRGIRITGGGFGGCCVAIVDNDKIESVKEHISTVYEEKCGLKADFYDVQIGNGPHIL